MEKRCFVFSVSRQPDVRDAWEMPVSVENCRDGKSAG